jgi:YlmC/YmxH family sporulation protein
VVRTSELRQKEVINLRNGRRLGLIVDLELDLEAGAVRGLVLPGSGRILGFLGREQDVVVPWDQVERIGVDVILVQVGEEKR